MRLRRARRGFTLIEVLLVLVILVILASVVVIQLGNVQAGALEKTARVNVQGLTQGVDLYHLDMNQYPSTSQGLQALFVPPGDLPNPAKWKGPYLKATEMPVDPWEQPFQYSYPGRMNTQSYDIWSVGADGQDGTADDIGNWKSQ